jgi:hypothetical protein
MVTNQQRAGTRVKVSIISGRDKRRPVIKVCKKKDAMTKVGFVRDVWENVLQHQQNELISAICCHSNEYELSPEAEYLAVSQEEWTKWPRERREHYVQKFNNL